MLGAVLAIGCGDDEPSQGAGGSTSVAAGSSTGSTTDAPSSSGATDASSETTDASSSSSSGEVDPYDGEPIEVPADGEWHFEEIEGMACNGGVASGVGVRRVEGSNKLVLYFKGGGACFNNTTCGFTSPLMRTGIEAMDANPTGVLNFDREDNPLLDYNIVYFPYCTGDVHAGVSGEHPIEGVDEPWNFVGHDNIVAALERVAPTFADVDELVVLGTSAGGLGALINFPFIHRGWPQTPTLFLDDSGIILPDEYLAPCLQSQLREVWGISSVLPAACEGCRGDDGGGLSNLFAHLPQAYPDVRYAMIASTRDQILRLFYGFGNESCTASGVPDLGEDVFPQALAALRSETLDEHFTMFVIDSDTHTWSTTPAFYMAESSGVSMAQWFADVLEGNASTVSP